MQCAMRRSDSFCTHYGYYWAASCEVQAQCPERPSLLAAAFAVQVKSGTTYSEKLYTALRILASCLRAFRREGNSKVIAGPATPASALASTPFESRSGTEPAITGIHVDVYKPSVAVVAVVAVVVPLVVLKGMGPCPGGPQALRTWSFLWTQLQLIMCAIGQYLSY